MRLMSPVHSEGLGDPFPARVAAGLSVVQRVSSVRHEQGRRWCGGSDVDRVELELAAVSGKGRARARVCVCVCAHAGARMCVIACVCVCMRVQIKMRYDFKSYR